MTDYRNKQDKELVELLTGNSREAFGELYARYRERLLYFCKQYLRNEEDAEDVVHDIFLQLWEKRHFLGTVSSFSGYVQTMIKNDTLKKLRHFDVHSRFARNILTNEIDSTNETEDAIIDNDYTKLLADVIERLPPKQKEVYRLSRIDGLSYKEVADMLHISVDTVQEHASVALKKIKKQLMKHADIHYKTLLTLLFLNF